jgi:hypothetical protein
MPLPAQTQPWQLRPQHARNSSSYQPMCVAHSPLVVQVKLTVMVTATVMSSCLVTVMVMAEVQVIRLVTVTGTPQASMPPPPLCGCQLPCGSGCLMLWLDLPGCLARWN